MVRDHASRIAPRATRGEPTSRVNALHKHVRSWALDAALALLVIVVLALSTALTTH